MTITPPYIGRFAPSPTGPLHFGSLVAAFGSFLVARQQRGHWLLRIEDLDQSRCRPEAEQHILHTLETHGLHWDGTIMRQTQPDRQQAYQQALDTLNTQGLTYPCYCSRKRLKAEAKHGIDGLIYPGFCQDLAPKPESREAPAATRLRVNQARIRVEDQLFGEHSHCLADDFGDITLKRRDGFFAYQLAVVVDDAAQGVTQVVRGADLLNNCTRQRYLQQLLGYSQPSYLHLPLVVDDTHTKLSKQHGASALAPEQALTNLRSAWAFLSQAPLPEASTHSVTRFIEQACQHFDLNRLAPQSKRVWPAP